MCAVVAAAAVLFETVTPTSVERVHAVAAWSLTPTLVERVHAVAAWSPTATFLERVWVWEPALIRNWSLAAVEVILPALPLLVPITQYQADCVLLQWLPPK